MSLKGKKIGVVITGSFCTFEKLWGILEELVKIGAEVVPIFSDNAASFVSRFGKGEDFVKKAEEITGKKAIRTIAQAEQIGTKNMFELLVVAPCTGNTLGKMANGITDTPALMAIKAHLRNENPVVISLSTNDALGLNMKNIGVLMSAKHTYFVPFGQDDYEKKVNSLVAHMDLLIPTLENALVGKQIQPVVVDYKK